MRTSHKHEYFDPQGTPEEAKARPHCISESEVAPWAEAFMSSNFDHSKLCS